MSIVEESTRKNSASDPRRDPTGPVHERDSKAARTGQQKVTRAEPQRGREALDPQRFAARGAVQPGRASPESPPGRGARVPEPPRSAGDRSSAEGSRRAGASLPDDPRRGRSAAAAPSGTPNPALRARTVQGLGNPVAAHDGLRNADDPRRSGASLPDDPRARAQQRAQSMAPRARPTEALSYRAPPPDVSRTFTNSDNPRKSSLTPARAHRNSDDPRALAPELRGTDDSDYDFAAPQAGAEFDEPDYEFAAPRASDARPSQREIVPPAARPRHPSQPGAAAPSRALTLRCEIDGIAVTIEPTDLSAAGLFVPTPIPPPLDSEVRVFLRIGDAEFEAHGHVVQSVTCEAARKERKRPGFGLLFTHIEDDMRARLRDAIDALLSERTERLRGIGTSSERPVSKPAPAIDPKEHEVLERLRGELAALKSQPPWSVLGISQGSEASCVREAFFAASKRYHPHVYARYALPEIKDVVTQLFIAYKRAFTSMTKTGRSQRNAPGGRAAGSGNPPGRSSDPGNK